jgi:membrane associated rhomboid family serine protease
VRLGNRRAQALSDWTTQAADAVEKAVILVRDKTVVPAQQGAKVVVYGFLTAFFALTAFMLVTILTFRVLVIFLPVWAAWLIVGGIFLLGGGFCWSRRTKKEVERV